MHVDRHHRYGVEIVARARHVVHLRRRIAGAHVENAEFGIERRGRPQRAAADRPGAAILGHARFFRRDIAEQRRAVGGLGDPVAFPAGFLGGVPAPDFGAVFSIVGREIAAPPEVALKADHRAELAARLVIDVQAVARPGDPGDDHAVEHQRRHVGAETALSGGFAILPGIVIGEFGDGLGGIGIGHRHEDVPPHRAGRHVEGDQAAVGGRHVDRAVTQRDAAISRAATEFFDFHLVVVAPLLGTGHRVKRDQIVERGRQIHHPIGDHRAGEESRADPGLIDPPRRQRGYRVGVDLIEGGKALVLIGMAVGQPIGRRIGRGLQTGVIDRRGGCDTGKRSFRPWNGCRQAHLPR